MSARIDIRKVALAVVVVLTMIAVVLPLCQALECDMPLATAGHPMDAGFSAACDLGTMISGGPSGVVPAGSQSLLLSLTMLIGVALMVVTPPRQLRFVRAVAEDPPAPPEDPRGVRLII